MTGKLSTIVLLISIGSCLLIGCKKEERPETPSSDIPEKIETAEVAVEFPKELQSQLDDKAREVVREVIDACVQGDYDRFRLMWTIEQDPYPRKAFERGWKAVQSVTILDVVKRRMPTEEGSYKIVFGVSAHVTLDPKIPEPDRDIVLLLIPEQDSWRLARPPGAFVREMLGITEVEEETPATQPASSEPV